MVLFLLPFAAVGVFATVKLLQLLLIHDWAHAGFYAIFALTFGGVGFGGFAAVLVGKQKLAAVEALKSAHPDSPWLWRPDWEAGRVDDATRQTVWLTWVFATFWNLIAFPSGFLGVRAAIENGQRGGLVALLFPLIGIGLLTWAIRSTLRYRRYGVSRFDLTTRPGVIGHSLSGTVRLSEALRPEGGFQVTLSCLRRYTTGTGDNRSTSESIYWQEQRRIPGVGTTIPIAFAIPADSRQCDDHDPNDRVLWRLEVSADVPGIDYASAFEVPVFRTAESVTPRTESEEAADRDPLAPAVYRQPATSRIEVTSNRRGTEIFYPAGRNPGMATSLTVFLLIWCAAIWACIHFKAPILFPIIFGLFGILILWFTLDAWLRVTRVTIEPGTITVASGYLTTGEGTAIPASDIADVTAAIGMQGGNAVYYDVTIVRKDGRKVKAGGSIRDKREAEWLAGTLKESLKH